MPSTVGKQVARARKAARLRGLRADLSLSDWLQTVRDFDGKCAYCDEWYWTIDHFISMARGGPTSVDNCVPSCSSCNARKGAQDPDLVWFLPHALIERIRQYLDWRGSGQCGWPPLSQHAIQREEGEPMNMKATHQWNTSLHTEGTKGKKILLYSSDQHVILQIRHEVSSDEDLLTPSARVAVPLTPAEAVALALELLRVASPQVDQMQTNQTQTERSGSDDLLPWSGKI